MSYTDTFDGSYLVGEMTATVVLKAVSTGTDVPIEQIGIPDAIPPEACIIGWQQSLANLMRLVEPDIPG